MESEKNAGLPENGTSDLLESSRKEVLPESFIRKLGNTEYRFKFLRSVSIIVSFFAFGFQVGQRGPSFLDFQLITGTNIETASTFFTVVSVGKISGSIISGFIYERFNKILLVIIDVVFLALTVIVIPLCSYYVLMLVVLWINSNFMEALNIVGNAYLMSLWRGIKDGEQYMQALHFAFALGGVVSPLVTAPFLASKLKNIENTTSPLFEYNSTLSNSSYNATVVFEVNDILQYGETRLIYAYVISGVLSLVSAFPFIYHYFSSAEKIDAPKKTSRRQERDLPLLYYVLTIVIFNFIIIFYCSVQSAFVDYLLTFVVLHMKWTKHKGSQLTSAFWSAFAVSRFSGIFFVGIMRPVKLLYICMLSLNASLVGFLVCSLYFVESGIWVFTVFAGFSMSVIFPTCLSWANESLVKVTGKITSYIVMAASIGGILNPIFLGYLMQELNPIWYCYLLLGESVICFCIFVFLLYFSKNKLTKVRIDKINHDIDTHG